LDDLYFEMNKFVKEHKLGKMFPAPVDVYLHEFSHLLADLIFIAIKNSGIVDYRKGIFGVPDLIVEIISPSSVYKDRVLKNKDYEQTGVQEYWLVDAKNQTVEVYENVDKTFELHSFAAETGKVQSKLLAGFELDFTHIFPTQ
jgi:Uma2 family endonuclease